MFFCADREDVELCPFHVDRPSKYRDMNHKAVAVRVHHNRILSSTSVKNNGLLEWSDVTRTQPERLQTDLVLSES